jgi:hypothetical protein
MTIEILIGTGGLLLSVLTYFAGVQRTQKRLSKDERNSRIQEVLNKYMGFRRTNYTDGLDGLKKAGIATLTSDSEMRELIDLIVKHGEDSPLGGKAHLFNTVDLKAFFDYAVKNQIDFFSVKLEDIIIKARNEG